MANIEKRETSKGIRYRVKVRLKGFPVQTATFERITDAKKWVQDTESAIREGRYFKTSEARKHTLAELIDRYIEVTLSQKPKSIAAQKPQLEWWKASIGDYTLVDITPALIVEYRDKLFATPKTNKEPRCAATVNRFLAALSHAFSVACNEWGWIENSPMRKVSKLKEPRGRVRFLSEEERTKILNACQKSDHPYINTIVVMALSTGMRQGEIVKLTWDCVDLQKKKIILHDTKNGERRVVHIAAHVEKLLRSLSRVRRIDTNLLFPSSKPHRIHQNQPPTYKPMHFRKSWERILLDCQIDDFCFHDLRHSAASYLAMNGASLAEIAEVLGHKTLQMVKRYAHLSEAHTAGVVERMNQKIFG